MACNCQDTKDYEKEFNDLIKKVNLFVNGSNTDVVQTNFGQVKSMANIQRTMESYRYVQKLVDYETYNQMIDDLQSYDIGILFNVWGDSGLNVNGVYQKQGNNTVVKVSYAELTQLIRATDVMQYNILNGVTGNTTSTVVAVKNGLKLVHVTLDTSIGGYTNVSLFGNSVNSTVNGVNIFSKVLKTADNVYTFKFDDPWPYLYAVVDSSYGTFTLNLNVSI